MATAWSIYVNVSCKLHPYSLKRTRSPPGPCLPKRIRSTHLRHYFYLKGDVIDVHFLFLSRGIIFWIKLPWPENLANTCARHTKPLVRSPLRGYHGIHSWLDLIRSKKLFSGSICCTQCLPDFLVMVIQFKI